VRLGGLSSRDRVEEHIDDGLTEARVTRADARQGDDGCRRELRVVETDDGDLVGNRDPRRDEGLEDTEGEEIVRTEDRVRARLWGAGDERLADRAPDGERT